MIAVEEESYLSKFVKRAEQEHSSLLFEESSLHLQPVPEENHGSDHTKLLNTSRAVFEMIGIEKEEDEENTRNVCTYLAECERSKGSLSNSVPSQQVSFALPELSLSDGDVSVMCSRIDSGNREKSSLEILDCAMGSGNVVDDDGVDGGVDGVDGVDGGADDDDVADADVACIDSNDGTDTNSDTHNHADTSIPDHTSSNHSIYNISSSSTENSPCKDRCDSNITSIHASHDDSTEDSSEDSNEDSPLEKAISGYLRSYSQQETRQCKRHTLLRTSPNSSPTSFHDIDTKQLFSPPVTGIACDRSPLSHELTPPQSPRFVSSPSDSSPIQSQSSPSRKRPYPSRSTRKQHHNTLLLCLESQLAGSSAGKAIVSAARSECLIGPDIQCPVHGVVLVMRKVGEVGMEREMNGRNSSSCGIVCFW